MRPALILTDPGSRAEPRQIARALSRRRVPFRLYTSVYFTPRSPIVHIARLLPDGSRRRLADTLLRRYESDIDARSIVRWVFPDVLDRLLRSAGVPDSRIYLLTNTLFDRLMALLIPRGTEIVIAMQGTALATLRRARRLGARTVVVANTPYPPAQLQIISDERRRLGLPAPPGLKADIRLHRRIHRELAEADLVLANSDYTRRDLIHHGLPSTKIVTTELGVDLSRFAPQRRAQRHSVACVLYVGSIQPRKGVIHLARAVDALRGDGVSCELDVYGPTADPRYVRLLAPYAANGVLRLRGAVSRDALPEVYASGDVFAFPTLSDGFGLVAYEAMACGLPVVVTDRCGAAIQDGVNGIVVPHGDATALRDAIRRLLLDPEFARSLAEAGKRTAQSRSWERYQACVLSALSRLDGKTLARFRSPAEAQATT